MKKTKLIAFLFLLSGIVFFSGCKGKDSPSTPIAAGIEGTWKLNTITGPVATPASYAAYVNGTFTFTTSNYTSKKGDNTDGEAGTYTFADNKVTLSGSGTVTPGTYNATLNGTTLSWTRNLANSGKPEQVFTFTFTKQ